MRETNRSIYQLMNKIAELEMRRDDLLARLPAHSIPPSMIAELDEIEDQLSQAKLQLAALNDPKM